MPRLNKKQLFWTLGLVFLAAYLFTRLFNLTTFPIFTDEAIYLRWAQIAGTDPDWRFISLTDGKQPLFVWCAALLMKIIADPLLAGRLVSVVAGFASMVGLYVLANELFKSRKIGLLAAFLYVLYPFSLVYDRMALYDSLVAAFIIWALYLEIRLVRQIQLKWAVALGIVIGIGLLNKTSVNFALLLLPFSLLLLDYKKKTWKQSVVPWAVFAGTAVILAQGIYAILRLSPFFYIITQKDAVFIYPLNEWLQHPFTFVLPNLITLWGWLVDYTTIPILIFIFAAFLFGRNLWKEKLLLLVWFVLPFIALATFGKLLYPRYILFMTMPLLVLGAYTLYVVLQRFSYRWVKAGLLLALMMPFLVTDMYILTDFNKASIARSDLNQYYRAWPAGGGVAETVAFFQKEARDKKIYIITEGTFGLMPYALEIYLINNPNVKIEPVWPLKDELDPRFVEISKKMPTYVVFYQPRPGTNIIGEVPKSWPVKKIYQYKKVETNTYHTIYQLLGQ